MRLITKMVLIFSVVMLIALFILSSLSATTVVDGSNAFTESRFRNMAASISQDLRDEFSLMQMTVQDLTGNPEFTAALNQILRDDSEEQKMGLAAGKIATTRMKLSPLVTSNHRVTFYTRDGLFLTSPALAHEPENPPTDYSNRVENVIESFPWLDRVDSTDSFCVLALHQDFLSEDPDAQVYGIVQRVYYQDEPIGYLEVDQLAERMERLLDYLDEDNIYVQIQLSNGKVLYSNTKETYEWPADLKEDTYTRVSPVGHSESFDAYHCDLEEYDLHLIIAQPSSIIDQNRKGLRWIMFRRGLYILIPAMVLIVLVSLNLTRSTRRLTRKVSQIPAAELLRSNPDEAFKLTETVTSPFDRETYELEKVLNNMIRQVRDQASTEMALREGTLQAQLNALQTQINPHFIYNTLNIISAKSMESGNYEVIEICNQFAQMLRYSTDTRTRTSTIAEEIENVRNYLMLAKARYEENLEYAIDVPDTLNDITVPKLMLQPLVENALTHGYDGKNVLRKLSISGRMEADSLILEIRDNGMGFSPEMLSNLRDRIREIEEGKVSIESSGGHIGLVNTCLRLYYYSHGTTRFAIRNDDGAVITITMPVGQK